MKVFSFYLPSFLILDKYMFMVHVCFLISKVNFLEQSQVSRKKQ